MSVVLLFVPVVDFVIIPGDLHQLADHTGESAQGDLLHVDIRRHLGSALHLNHGQPDLLWGEAAVALREGEDGVLAGAQNVPLLYLGRVGVVGQGALQPAKLLVGVAAEGDGRPAGEEHLPLVDELFPDGSQYQIMLRFTPQQLDGIGVAVDQQGEQLVKSVHSGIRLRIHHLLKVTHTQQVSLAVQGAAPDVNVGVLYIGPIGIAASVGEENNILSETWATL